MLNKGVSFGLFPDIPIQMVVFLWGAMFLYVSYLFIAGKMRELLEGVGMGLVLIGGAGNIVNRIQYGGVKDNLVLFGVLHNNIWDYLIGLGVIIFLYSAYKTWSRK